LINPVSDYEQQLNSPSSVSSADDSWVEKLSMPQRRFCGILLAVLSLCILCFRRRAARRRRAVAAAAPKFYPEVSYLYDPPPGAPAPGPGQPLMASQRSVPDTAYTGAAGVAAAGGPAGPEKEGLLGNVPSARSVLAPLSGYARAGQEENPFGDQAAAQYRDSLDHRQ